MNILALIVIIILLLYTFWGYKAGLIKTVFSICSMLIALLLTLVISPQISQALQEKESVMNFFTEQVESALNLDKIDNSVSNKVEEIKKLPIPKSIKDTLIDNNNPESYDALNVTNFTSYISRSVASVIINALSFVVVFLILYVGLRILCAVLNIISKLPVLHQINKLTGLIAGFIRGLFVIWLLCIVLTVSSTTSWGKSCFEMINESAFLGLIYNNNFIVKFIANISSSLL